jgi:hypothetical protein
VLAVCVTAVLCSDTPAHGKPSVEYFRVMVCVLARGPAVIRTLLNRGGE